MKIIEIMKDFWYRLKRFTLWAGKFAIAIFMMGHRDLKEFFERRRIWKKG